MQSYFSCGDIGLVSSIGKVRSAERFLDYFEGTVDRFRGTGKPNFVLSWSVLRQIFSVPKLVIMLNNFLIADRAMPWRQLITRPTMVDNNSATLIYNIFTNKCSEYYASGHNISDMTDHFSQCWIFQSSIERTQPVKVTPLDYWKFSKQKFLQPNLSQLRRKSLLSGSDVGKLFAITNRIT